MQRRWRSQVHGYGRERTAGAGGTAGDDDDVLRDEWLALATAGDEGTAAALRSLITALDAEISKLHASGGLDLASQASNDEATAFHRRATASRLYVEWRQSRLQAMHQWCCAVLAHHVDVK